MQTCRPCSTSTRCLRLLLLLLFLSAPAAGCVVNPGVVSPPLVPEAVSPPLVPEAVSPPDLPPALSPARRLPLVFPEAWRGLRTGGPLGGCPPFDPAEYWSDGAWPRPRLVGEDGLHRDVLACTTFERPQDASLAFVVPPREAHEHGLCRAPAAMRAAFAADPDNWVYAPEPVLAYGRRERGPGAWLPTRNACWYVRAHLRLRVRYGLSITPEDAEAIDRILELCGDQGHVPAC